MTQNDGNGKPDASLVFKEPKFYEVDWDKITTVKQVGLIFKGAQIRFSDDHAMFEEIKPYLQEEEAK